MNRPAGPARRSQTEVLKVHIVAQVSFALVLLYPSIAVTHYNAVLTGSLFITCCNIDNSGHIKMACVACNLPNEVYQVLLRKGAYVGHVRH